MWRIARADCAERLDHELVERAARRRARRRRRAPARSAGSSKISRACVLRPSAATAPGSAARRRGTSRRGATRPGSARKTRFANGAASRFASPRCASASVSAAGIRIVAAASTIGPATNPPPPRTTSGRRRREDRAARERRAAGAAERAYELRRRLPRQAADPERVELVAGLRNEPRLDAIRRPGERHVHAALRQRFRDRERRQHVSGRPPGRDHAPKLRLRCHDGAMLRRMPTAASSTTRLDPPYETNGSGIPVSGATPITAAMLIAAWPQIEHRQPGGEPLAERVAAARARS